MLVSTMTYYEKYTEYSSDYEKIRIKVMQSEQSIVRKFRKTTKFPAIEMIHYKIPKSGNTYVIFFFAYTKIELEKPHSDYFAVYNDKKAQRIYVMFSETKYAQELSDSYKITPKIDEYTMHFMSRYKERVLGNKIENLEEVACHYFIRNRTYLITKLNEHIMRNYMQYGQFAHYGIKVEKGLCLVRSIIEQKYNSVNNKKETLAIGIKNITFIDNRTLQKEQVFALMKENYNYCRMLYESEKPFINRNKYL